MSSGLLSSSKPLSVSFLPVPWNTRISNCFVSWTGIFCRAHWSRGFSHSSYLPSQVMRGFLGNPFWSEQWDKNSNRRHCWFQLVQWVVGYVTYCFLGYMSSHTGHSIPPTALSPFLLTRTEAIGTEHRKSGLLLIFTTLGQQFHLN